MASIIIRNLPEKVKENLRVQAAQCGMSLEAHVRNILHNISGVDHPKEGGDIVDLASLYFGEANGIDLDLPDRGSGRDETRF
ncbi:MAG: hypothetical protein R3A50_04440 [Saprospiraceae bacterium]|nr:hypothetical protein [Saprospiraceae bacterium]MCB9342630.1 hypothetical protein [Lewinellaceae bacterium]